MKKFVFYTVWLVLSTVPEGIRGAQTALQAADAGEVVVLPPSLHAESQRVVPDEREGNELSNFMTSIPGFQLSLSLESLPKNVLFDILKLCQPHSYKVLCPPVTDDLTEDNIEKEAKNIQQALQYAINEQQVSPALTRILCLDGGGTRGVIALYFLNQLESITGKPTYQLFDHVAATSVGSLIATLLTVQGLGEYKNVRGVADRPFTAAEALEAFMTLAPVIFGTKKSRFMSGLSTQFDEKPFNDILTALLGEKTLLDSLIPITFTAYNINKQKPRIYSTFKVRENPSKCITLKNAILSSTAAPSYFIPSESHDIDGGISFNNPSMIGALITWRYMKKDPSQHILLSIGTGIDKAPATRQDMEKLYLPQIASKVMEFFFNGTNMAKLTKEFYSLYGAPYFRFQSAIGPELNKVDIVSERDFEKLIDCARTAFEEETKTEFDRLIPYLMQKEHS